MEMKELWKGLVALFNMNNQERKLHLQAVKIYKQGCDEALEKYASTGKRWYSIWDPRQRKLISITYDACKGRRDSYQYLRQRGAIKGSLSRNDLKDNSYYFTASKNGARPMSRWRQMRNIERLKAVMKEQLARETDKK